MSTELIDELMVVELVGSIAGGYAAKLLADRGAQVTLVDPNPPPLTAEHAAWHYLHANKTVVAELGELAEQADLVIESSAPDPLQPEIEGRPDLVRLHLSPHGQTGVYAGFRSNDLTDYALSGHQSLYGHPDRHPLPGPPNQPAYAAGLLGCIGALSAILSGEPDQTVEVSHVEAMASLHQFTLLRHQFGGQTLKRMGNRFTGQGEPNTIYPCLDGWVAITCVTDQQMEDLLGIIDRSWVLDDLESPKTCSSILNWSTMASFHGWPNARGTRSSSCSRRCESRRVPLNRCTTCSLIPSLLTATGGLPPRAPRPTSVFPALRFG